MKLLSRAVLGALCSLAGVEALAEERVLEEVVVTAQKRAQSLQDVPISISVVSAEDLQRNSIFDFAETADFTPGVSMNSASAALASISVRGVGPGFFAPTAQSVPLFVDEVPAAQPGVVFNTMVDVERVELLRGPQGTLYGKNAPSGAYNITTVSPRFEETGGFINATYYQWDANNEPGTDIRGAVNVPISKTLAARFTGVYAETDGGVEMESPFATQEATGGKDHTSLRMRLLWEPNDETQVHLISNYQDLDDYYALRLFDGLVPATGGSNEVDAMYTRFSDRSDFGDKPSSSGTEVKDVALKYEWTGELTNIDLIISYQDFDTTLFQNQDPYPKLDPNTTDLELEAQQTTFELRASDTGDRFDYVAGIFISDTDTDTTTILDNVAYIPAFVTESTFGAAVFGNFTFHLARQWDFSVGARYEDNSQDYESEVDISGFQGNIDDDLDFDHLSWSLKLNYFADENTTFYAAIDNAYRQGGINSYVPAIAAVGVVLENPAIVETAEAFLEYDEEVSTAFEVGVKGNLLDNSMRYSLAVFYQEFDDHIIRQNEATSEELAQLGALYTLVFVNAEEVVTQGAEFDVTYLISENWTVDFRSAYFDATVEEWNDRLCTHNDNNHIPGGFCPAESGSELAILPKLNTNTQLSYFDTLDNGWDFYSTLAWTWRSESAMNNNTTSRYDDPQNFLNLTVGMSNETFSVAVWGKNLTDELNAQVPYETANGDPDLPGALTASHNPGLNYGITLGYKF